MLKHIALTTCLSKLEKDNFLVLATVQGGGVNRTRYERTLMGEGGGNKNYVKGLNNLESYRINRSKDKMTRYSQYWWWCPKNNMDGKFYGIYMNHLSNKHDGWEEEKQKKRESYKQGRSQSIRGSENSNRNSGSVKSLTLYSHTRCIPR